jgi:hypothetical protein
MRSRIVVATRTLNKVVTAMKAPKVPKLAAKTPKTQYSGKSQKRTE